MTNQTHGIYTCSVSSKTFANKPCQGQNYSNQEATSLSFKKAISHISLKCSAQWKQSKGSLSMLVRKPLLIASQGQDGGFGQDDLSLETTYSGL